VVEALTSRGAIDGELLVMRDGAVASFGDLQQRLNRKTVDAKQLEASRPGSAPTTCCWTARPTCAACRSSSAAKRLEAFVGPGRPAHRPVADPAVRDLGGAGRPARRSAEGDPPSKGLMLKRWDSVYEPGRPKGPWFKWKRDPRLIDAVLMYAQRGHGKRSSFYSDYTFGVWREDERARQPHPGRQGLFRLHRRGAEADRQVRARQHRRALRPGALGAGRPGVRPGVRGGVRGLQRSTRHKSGVAMRFPRISRIRWDKPSREADELETLERMLD
jgi:DNA ligase-1